MPYFLRSLNLLIKFTAKEKEPYEVKARADQKRYKEAMAGYRSALRIIDSGNESADSN